MCYDRRRIEALRLSAVEPVICYDGFYLAFFERWAQNEALGSIEERYANAYERAFEGVEPVIDEGEIIVGKATKPLSPEKAARWLELKKTQADPLNVRFGQDSHMAVDYELVLREGTQGIAARVQKLLENEKDARKRRFYALCGVCLNAVAAFSDRYAAYAEGLAARSADEARRREL